MRPLLLTLALSHIFSFSVWSMSQRAAEVPLVQPVSLKIGTSNNDQKRPNNHKKFITTTFKSLSLQSGSDTPEGIHLALEGINSQAGETIIGSSGNQGISSFTLAHGAGWYPLHTLRWDLFFTNNHMTIGQVGQGLVDIRQESELYRDRILLGEKVGSSGTLHIQDAGSTVHANVLILGARGNAQVEILQGAKVFLKQMKMGTPSYLFPFLHWSSDHTNNRMLIDGISSQLELSDSIFLAKNGTAHLEIRQGAQVHGKNLLEQKMLKGASNSLRIVDRGQLLIDGRIQLGEQGPFTAEITNRSQIQAQSMILGGIANDTHINTLHLRNHSEALIAEGLSLVSQKAGQVEIQLEDHSQLRAHTLWVGAQAQGNSRLTLDQASTFYGHSATIGSCHAGHSPHSSVSSCGLGEVIIRNHSQFTVEGDLMIGHHHRGLGKVILQNKEDGLFQKTTAGGETLLKAHRIFLGGTDTAMIIADNQTHTPSNMTIQGNIHGQGTIEKRGLGALNLLGENDWTGQLNIRAGSVHLERFSTLGQHVNLHIDQGARLKSDSAQTVVNRLHLYGDIDFASEDARSTWTVNHQLSGKGSFWLSADFHQKQADTLIIHGAAEGEHTLHVHFNNEPSTKDNDSNRLLLVQAQTLPTEEKIWTLNTGHKDAQGAYYDFGIIRYDIDLVQEKKEHHPIEWYLERKKRIPTGNDARQMSPAAISTAAQHVQQQVTQLRRSQNLMSANSFTRVSSVPTEAQIMPILTNHNVKQEATLAHPLQSTSTLGLSYQLPYQQSLYTLEALQTRHSKGLLSLQPNTIGQTEIIRAKWQHPTGWQSFIGMERSDISTGTHVYPSHPTTHFRSHLTHAGVSYLWPFSTDWSHGPQIQYTRWHSDTNAMAWDSYSQSPIQATSQHTYDLQLGWHIAYTSPLAATTPWSLQASGFLKQHHETLHLHTSLQSLTLPMDYQEQILQAQWGWQYSPASAWSLTTEQHFQKGTPTGTHIFAQWNYRF